jgi:hypothetical protein
MNLGFRRKSDGKRVGFPFQTSTNLSYEVFKGESIEHQLAIIENELMTWTWSENMISDTLADIEGLLRDPTLELVVE